ncbi:MULTISPECIES: prepilin peptidase [unclassified Novosphingobium]|uniref:prepilin peptidase n=1 Tax=unclassified Novosphingobium TaxID=2644732 RepID=UPI001357D891|nr:MULTISPECIES: prepilin peptidase [unclassified Novosphingobium]
MHNQAIVNFPVLPWLAAAAALGLLLLSGAVIHSDLGRRRIPNSLCIAIAVLGLLFAVGEAGWSGLPDFAWRMAIAVLVGLPLALLFLFRLLGGGDVKLLAALLLWVPASDMPAMFAVTVLTGALVAIALKLLNRVFCFIRADTVPYGLAIVVGALCVLIPRFDGLAAAACTFVA